MQVNNYRKGHLSQEERVIIEFLWKNGRWKSCCFIGKELKRDRSVVSREIERNGIDKWLWTKKWYSAKIAEHKEKERRRKANFQHRKLIKDPKMLHKFREVFEEKYKSQWVDEVIGALRNLGIEMVCTSTMYDFIHTCKQEWEYMLRYGKHWYKKRSWKKRTALVGVPLIEERDEEVNNRSTFGNWEVDMIVWPKWEKWWLLTIVERLSRYTIIVPLVRATKSEVQQALIGSLASHVVTTITSDNWSEFAGLRAVWDTLGCQVYRCHPYASWEKWGNERNNGIIRRFCPKTLSIQQYSVEYIQAVEDQINEKPRKILGYRTAKEMLKSHIELI